MELPQIAQNILFVHGMQKFEHVESMISSVTNSNKCLGKISKSSSCVSEHATSECSTNSMHDDFQVPVSDASLFPSVRNVKDSLEHTEPRIMAPIIDPGKSRYPFCIVWTPIIPLTWLFPFIGHMGIARSDGVIRDFAGPYFVSEDDMAFGQPTLYWQLDPALATGGSAAYDAAVQAASVEYFNHMHNLFCDNCHSMVALALNQMKYRGKENWSMIQVCILMLVKGRFVSVGAAIKTWLPFTVLIGLIVTLVLVL